MNCLKEYGTSVRRSDDHPKIEVLSSITEAKDAYHAEQQSSMYRFSDHNRTFPGGLTSEAVGLAMICLRLIWLYMVLLVDMDVM